MEIERICKECGKKFIAIKTNQFFCCRRCFKKDFYTKTKIKNQLSCENPKYPLKKCQFCGESFYLDFDPKKHPDKFNNCTCPKCGVSNKVIWRYQNDCNSRISIMNFLVSNKDIYIEKQSIEYKVYHIPINIPEQCSNNIITLSCENIDLLDIHKKNRKKITFS